VAVIGTGASAAQIVPELAKVAQSLSVFQRTPQWILPRSDKPFTEEQKRRFARNPIAARRHRKELYWAFENTIAFRHGEEGADQLKALAESHIEYRIKDDELRAKLTPDYPFGCKRTLVCSDFYKAMLRDNVELVTDGIQRVTPDSIVTTDGRERPVDAIVLATGFKATEYLHGIDVIGVDGRRLHDDWDEVAHAYMGLTVSGYPNFFMLYGPNTNQGGNSIIVILEAQATYVLSALRSMHWRRVRAVDVRRDVMDGYNRELQEALAGTIWNDGCQSYFKNANGKIATQLPQTSRWYAKRTKRFRMREYVQS
jgi:cation diffusion facilitator CzcD-associated flavoprotein CzcO